MLVPGRHSIRHMEVDLNKQKTHAATTDSDRDESTLDGIIHPNELPNAGVNRLDLKVRFPNDGNASRPL